jgi:hypothetical protein
VATANPEGAGGASPRRGAWSTVAEETADTLTVQQGQVDPSLWRKPASQTGFVPGLLPNRFPTTNRPTFQQVLEFQHPKWHWGWGR